METAMVEATTGTWEIRAKANVGRRETGLSREFVARKRFMDGRLSASAITAIFSWSDQKPAAEQEERCVALFLQFVKEIAKQNEVPFRR
jgi:hypothetical protein